MKLTNKIIYIGFLTGLFCFSELQTLKAQDVKLGLVNFKTCVELSSLGKQEQTGFEAIKKQMDGLLEQKEKSLAELSNKLNDADYVDSLSHEAEAELKHKFRSLSQELAQYQQQYYQMLNQTNYKVIQKLTAAVHEASKIVAQNKKLNVVLNDEAAFYSDKSLDISQDVIKAMDEAFKNEEKKEEKK